MSAYAEVTVVVDGALDVSAIYHDETLMHDQIADVVEEAKSDGYPTEIYVMFHDHDESEDCECIQFETSHLPKVTVNSEVTGEWASYLPPVITRIH